MLLPSPWAAFTAQVTNTHHRRETILTPRFAPDDDKTCLLSGNWGQRQTRRPTGCKPVCQEQQDHPRNCCWHKPKRPVWMLVLKGLSLASQRLMCRQVSENHSRLFHQPACQLHAEEAVIALPPLSAKTSAELSACWWHRSLITHRRPPVTTRPHSQGGQRVEGVLIVCFLHLHAHLN